MGSIKIINILYRCPNWMGRLLLKKSWWSTRASWQRWFECFDSNVRVLSGQGCRQRDNTVVATSEATTLVSTMLAVHSAAVAYLWFRSCRASRRLTAQSHARPSLPRSTWPATSTSFLCTQASTFLKYWNTFSYSAFLDYVIQHHAKNHIGPSFAGCDDKLPGESQSWEVSANILEEFWRVGGNVVNISSRHLSENLIAN